MDEWLEKALSYVNEDTIARLKGMRPKNDAELERYCWYGYSGVPGSVVSALYPLIKRETDKTDAQLLRMALEDSERIALLAKNLMWEKSN